MSQDFWTDERVELLEKLFPTGLSCRLIAAKIGHGCTRNAVIGKIYRLRLKRELPSEPWRIRYGMSGDPAAGRRKAPRVPRAPKPPKPQREKRQRRHNNFAGFNFHRRKAGPRPAEQRVAAAMIEVQNAKPWLERGFGECAYPVSGEGADTLSCCNPAAATYCAGHAALMFTQPEQSAERLVKWGARFAA